MKNNNYRFFISLNMLWVIFSVCVIDAGEQGFELYDDDFAKNLIKRDPIKTGTVYDFFTKNQVTYPRLPSLSAFWKLSGINAKRIKLVDEAFLFDTGYAHFHLSKTWDIVIRAKYNRHSREKWVEWMAIVPHCNEALEIAMGDDQNIWKNWTFWNKRMVTVKSLKQHLQK